MAAVKDSCSPTESSSTRQRLEYYRGRRVPGRQPYVARRYAYLSDEAADLAAAIASSLPRGALVELTELLNAYCGKPCEEGPLGEWHVIFLRDGFTCFSVRSFVVLEAEGADHEIVAFYC